MRRPRRTIDRRTYSRLSFLVIGLTLTMALNACSDLPSEPGQPRSVGDGESSGPPPRATIPAITSRACSEGVQASGAIYKICVPSPWNGELIVYAHGYKNPRDPLEAADDEIDGTSVSEIVNELGFAFASSSYSKNGLAVLPGIGDLVDVVGIFSDRHGQPGRVYLVGVSEGGVITALGTERHPEVFSGGLAGCGPVGNFRGQINYFGDFRVVFDYFFPGVIPGSAAEIPEEVQINWETVYVPAIQAAIAADPDATRQLLRVTRAPTDPFDPSTIEETIIGLLWYNVFATNDGIAVLGGQPFDNRRRFYFGSNNDLRLNLRVARFRAEGAALDEVEANYETTGVLHSPVVAIHTTGDPIIPYWHEPLYVFKTIRSGSILKHASIPVFRYGHCNFEVLELLVGFAVLVLKTSSHNLLASTALLPTEEDQTKFLEQAHAHGADPILAIPTLPNGEPAVGGPLGE